MAFFLQVCLALLGLTAVLAVLPQDYEALSAKEKQTILWNQIKASPYANNSLPIDGVSATQAAQLLVPTFLRRSFTRINDELDPVDRPWKIIHTFGTCAKANLVIFPNSSYTGVFKSGAPGLVRLSAVRYDPTNLIPSMGFKALIDGQPSVNFHNVFSPDGQGMNKNFFQNNVSNIIPDSEKFALKVVAKSFEATIRLLSVWSNERPLNANTMPLYEQSAIDTKGQAVEEGKIYAPYRIDYVPNPAIGYSPNATEDFRLKIAEVPVGSPLYTLVAYRTQEQGEAKAGGEIIGQLVTDGPFVAANYCDHGLYLNHASRRWQKN